MRVLLTSAGLETEKIKEYFVNVFRRGICENYHKAQKSLFF